MSIVIFVGPTLDNACAKRELHATFLPPARQGDVYLAARARPWGIGLIDGYFQHVPAVWHKEILWALAQGIHVFGAASMGALRAAELAAFGMRGVGNIFADYERGVLHDDDEVTILHSDADSGYRTMSDAMVNIRATVAAAVAQGIIGTKLSEELLTTAKGAFYQQRSYTALLQCVSQNSAHPEQLKRFEQWLPVGKIDQKRSDAIALLHAMAAHQRQHPGPLHVNFHFQHTDAWEQVRRRIHLQQSGASPVAGRDQSDEVLSEFRLLGPAYVAARDNAFVHALCEALVASTAENSDVSLLEDAILEFRRHHGLLEAGSLEPWLDRQGLDNNGLLQLLRDDLTVQRQRVLFDAEIERVLVQQLRLSGCYAGLQARAAHKRVMLCSSGLDNPSLVDAGIDETALWDWYFDTYLAIAVRPDLSAHARTLVCTVDMLRHEVLREWCFQMRCGIKT